MKVLIITPIFPPDIGGPATYSYEIADRLNEGGTKIDVLTFTKGVPKSLKSGSKVFCISSKNAVLRELKLALSLIRLAPKYDIIFSANAFTVGVLGTFIARLYNKKTAISFVGDAAWERMDRESDLKMGLDDYLLTKKPIKTEIFESVQKVTLHASHKIIVRSQYMADFVSKNYDIPKSKIDCIPMAIAAFDVPDKRKKELRDKYHIDDKMILTACRLMPYKRVDDLINHMKEVTKKFPNARLLIAGDGPEKESLKKQANSLNLANNVTFLGVVPHKHLMELMATTDLFVLNSRGETFGFVLMEALSMGTPTLARKEGAIPEILGNGPYLTDTTATQTIIEALKNRPKVDSEKIQDIYSWKRVEEETKKSLFNLLRSKL